MSKMKKGIALTLSLALCASTGLSLAGCKKDKVIVDGKTINIRAYKAGNGVEWLYELASKFEEVYEEEGYKVNILTPSNDMMGDVVLTDMSLGAEETGIDLYITANIDANKVGELGDYGVLAEDIEETVFNKAPIGYDGQEEDKLVSEKIDASRAKYSRDDNGVMYAFQYTGHVAGLSVNTKKLDMYGLEIPKTTNELLECMETIYTGTDDVANSTESNIYPITFVQGTNGYVVGALTTFLAQYDKAQYEQFWSMQTNVDGTLTDMLTDGYNVYDLPCVEEMLTLAYALMDQRIATRGSTTQALDQAQAKLMEADEGAVFMFNGSWMLNEVRLNYKNNIQDVTFTRIPLISALGTKLMGSGTTYNLDEEKCDDILSYVVGLVDENETIENIITKVTAEFDVTLSNAVVQEIATARGAVYQRGVEEVCYINKNAAAKEPAELFLRMMASDDFAQTWLDCAYSTTAYASDMDLSDVPYDFVKEAAKISLNKYANIVRGEASGLRKELGLGSILANTAHIPSAISAADIVSMYDMFGNRDTTKTLQVYRDAANVMQEKEVQFAKDNWALWIKELED